MPHDNNSHIYTETVQGVKYGISTGDVAYVLGVASDDVGTLCTDSGINKYAKYKPCGGSSPGTLSETERKAVNCGIDCSDSATGCFSTNLSNLLTRAKATNDWTKVSPTWYRLLDFDGYHHYASQPYQSQVNIAGNVGSSVYITRALNPILETYNMRLSDLVGALTAGGRSISSYHFGLLYRNASTPTATPSIIDLGAANLEGVNPGGTFTISTIEPPASSVGVTYDACFIAFVENSGAYYGCFIPKGYFQMKLSLFAVYKNDGQTPIANETMLIDNQQGGEFRIKIHGFSWGYETGKELDIRLSPSQGSETYSYTESDVVVGAVQGGVTAASGYAIQQVRIYAPGLVGTNPDFDLVFFVKQKCPTPPPQQKWLYPSDSQGNFIGNAINISPTYGIDTTVYLTYNCAWYRNAITKVVNDEEVITTDIQFPPSSRPAPSGAYSTYETYVYNNVPGGLVPGTEYFVYYADTSNPGVFDPDDPSTYNVRRQRIYVMPE